MTDDLHRIVPDRLAGEPVIRTSAYPPGKHPAGAPIIPELWAVAAQTPTRTRWRGVIDAWIGSDLRMHVILPAGAERDETLRTWDRPAAGVA